MNTTYKIVNVTNGAVIVDNLDFYDGRYRMGESNDLTMMESDADVSDRLARRAELGKVLGF
jgi:hypothetical protein